VIVISVIVEAKKISSRYIPDKMNVFVAWHIQTRDNILTFQDELSKFLVAIPILRQDAETVAREFVKHIILRIGTPSKLLTDQGANFLSEVFRITCKLLKIKKLQTTLFHPESNGSLERSHKVLKEYLRH
jgi:hypothetical protein